MEPKSILKGTKSALLGGISLVYLGLLPDASVTIFKSHPRAENRRGSAVTLIKLLLANKTPEVLPEHLRELLDTMLWKITEADGKYKTRHQSHSALQCSDKRLLRHDHVYPKEKMIDALLNAKPEEVDGILPNPERNSVPLRAVTLRHDGVSF